MLYYMNWLTHDFWTRTGEWEFDRSHGASTSSPSHWQQIEEQAPKPVGWMMCFLRMTFVPAQKLCVDIYIYMQFLYFYMSSVFFLFTNCVLLSNDNSLIPGCLWLLTFVLTNTLILGIWCSIPPRLFLSLDLLSEYRIQYGAIGPLYVTSNYLPPACWSTFWKSIFKQQLGCRFDIMDSISSFFCTLTYAIKYVLIHHTIFGFIFT